MTETDRRLLRRVGDGNYWMARGVTGEWLIKMTRARMIRVRSPCESNGWRADHVLTPAGRSAAAMTEKR